MSNQNPIDGQLTIIDAEGNEKLCQILFTLDSEEFNKKYVVFYEISTLGDSDDDSEIPLMAASYVEMIMVRVNCQKLRVMKNGLLSKLQ